MKKICFIGTGWMGATQIKQLSEMKDVDIVVIIEKNIKRGKSVAKEIGLENVEVIEDFDYALDNFDFDIVWIVSPNNCHSEQAIKAMKRNKHVFCEKPASTSFEDYLTEIEIEKNNPKLRTLVDYILYFNPMEKSLVNLVEQKGIGTISQIQVNYRHSVNIEEDRKWKLKHEYVGDALGMGINHAISVIINIMKSQAKPVSVYATSHNLHVRNFEVDPIWTIFIKFDNGATGICLGNIDEENGYDLYHSISASDGGFIFDSRIDLENKIRLWSRKLTNGKWIYPLKKDFKSDNELVRNFCNSKSLPDSGDVLDHQVKDVLKHFLSSIDGDISPLSFNNSKVISEIGWAAQLSSQKHIEIKLPLSEKAKVALKKFK